MSDGAGPQMSNYPNGFNNGLTVRGLPVLNSYPGSTFWVDSVNGADGNPGTFQRPVATIDAAVGKCTASRGDLILVKAGHLETLTTASALAVDVIGVSIVGLGLGNNRPQLTLTPATTGVVLIAFSAASTSIRNIICIAGLDAVTTPILVSAAGVVLDIEWRDGSSLIEAATAILTTAAADNFIANLKYIGFPAGNACVSPIKLVGCNNGLINLDFYGLASTAVVEFATTLSNNIEIYGYVYNSGDTTGVKLVVDTITNSLWFANVYAGAAGASFSGGSGATLASDDTSTIAANQTVPTADSTANVLERDVAGNKTDAQVVAVGTTKSLVAYAKGLIVNTIAPAADTANNIAVNDVVGNKTDASIYVPGTTKSVAAYAKGIADLQERVAVKAAATIVNAQTLFTVTGGPILVEALWSECVTANDGTASTLQYSATPTVGAAQTLSAASASLASAAAGASVSLIGTALTTAALLNANGPTLGMTAPQIIPAGTITAVVAVGSTTGTWRHYIRYRPLAVAVTVA